MKEINMFASIDNLAEDSDDCMIIPCQRRKSDRKSNRGSAGGRRRTASSTNRVAAVKKSPSSPASIARVRVEVIEISDDEDVSKEKPASKPLAAQPLEIIEISDDEDVSKEKPASTPLAARRSATNEPVEMDTYFAEDNEVIMIKVMWELKYQQIPLRRHQPFKHLIEVLAKHSGKPADTIVLNTNEQFVHQTDTPDTIKYNIATFIYARGMDEVINFRRVCRDVRIALKVQSAGWKRPLVLHIQPTQKMKVLVILCAEQMQCKPARLHFQFDGEPLDLEATAKDLELEGGEVFDMRIV